MARLFYHICQDNVGNLLFDVTGTMRVAGSGTLATIYGDEALTVILPNPMTNHPSFASFKCFLGAGDYDFYLAKSGYTFETLTGVQGHGTLAQQDANAVAITGGSALGLTEVQTGRLVSTWLGAPTQAIYINDTVASNVNGLVSLLTAGTGKYNLNCQGTAPNYLGGNLGIATPPTASRIAVGFAAGASALTTQPATAGTVYPLYFLNNGGGNIGSIATTDTATAYNTASDVRLKEFVETLVGSLDIIRVLNPISFLWKSNNERGEGLAANELQQVIPYAVTGEPDAVSDDGSIIPQQVDYSKLVPRLVGAIQELLARVEALELSLAP